jgi:hypothetical protein
MRVVAFVLGIALAAMGACSLAGGVKDACETTGDCNPGNVCTNGTCGPPGPAMDDAGLADADAGAPDAPPPFCLNAPRPFTICDDFDEDAQAKNTLAGWDNILNGMDIGASGMGAIAGNSNASFVYTPPRSIFFSLPALVHSSDQAVANLVKKVNAPSALGVQFRFYIRTQSLSGTNRLELVFVDFSRAAGFEVVLDGSGLQAVVAVGAQPVETTYPVAPLTAVPDGTWHQLVISMIIDGFDGGPPGFGIFLDGNATASGALPGAFADAGADEVDIGPAAEGPMGIFEIYMDNVLVQ